jgi:hypothetical protein
MNRGKSQRMKSLLEGKGIAFPSTVDFGAYNRKNNVFRSRLTWRAAERELKAGDLDAAMEDCKNTMTLLAEERVRDPLVEIETIAKLVATVVKVSPSIF